MVEEAPRRSPLATVVAAAALAVVLAVLAGPAAGAGAGAEAGAGEDVTLEILREPAGEGPVPAEVPVTFTWLLLDGDGRPSFHHDAVVEVRFEGETLLETSPASGHDYDGIDPYRVAFPGPGSYEVRVDVKDGEGGTLVEETVEGRVGPGPNGSAPAFLEAPAEVSAGEPFAVAYGLGSADDPVPGTDLQIRVLRADDGFLETKLETAAGDGLHEVRLALDEPGPYELEVVGARAGDDARAPAAASTVLRVGPGPDAPVEAPPTRPPLENKVTDGESGGPYELYGTYDPYTSIGPDGRIRLGVAVVDPADRTAPGEPVDFDATLRGPHGGTQLEVGDLREEDGILIVTVSPSSVGDHVLDVRAEAGAWSGSVELRFSVLPPVGALGAGPQFTTLEAPEANAGEPVEAVFEVADAAGNPLPHGEVDVRVLDGDGLPVVEGKLHTHLDGRFPLTVAFPAEGEHVLEASPETLQPAPMPRYYGPELGTRPAFPVDVGPGGALDRAEDIPAGTAGEGDAELGAPTGPMAALALAGAGLAAGRGRRGR